jgi:hypothetical protein
MAAENHFEIWAGDTASITITVKDEAGVVVNIAGAAIEWCLRQNLQADTKAVTKTVGSGITITDGPAGKFVVTLTVADTEDLSGLYYHEAVVTLGSEVSTVIQGLVAVHNNVASASYASFDEVKNTIPWFEWRDTLKPTAGQAQLIIQTVSDEIDGVLLGRGYSLPLTDTQALKYLKTINIWGSVSSIIKSRQMSNSGIGGDGGAADFWETKYTESLKLLASETFSLPGDETGGTDSGSSFGYGIPNVDIREVEFEDDMSFSYRSKIF